MARARLRKRAMLAAVAMLAVIAVATIDRLFPPPLQPLADVSTVIEDRQGQPLRVFANSETRWRLSVAVDDVAPVLIDLLIAREDRRFFAHPGFDPLAAVRALAQNLTAGRIVSGASTLTMQVARLLEPRPRTMAAKLIEVGRALQLEVRFNKRQILAMYLTLAPFGGNLEGVRAASLSLFGKEPRSLTLAEAALLVALPQAPSRLRVDRHPDAAVGARNRVLAQAAAQGVIDGTRAAEAAAEPLTLNRSPWPLSAAHLAERLRRAAPGQSVLRTTIDGRVQRALEALARREMPSLLERAGLAIIAVDNRSRQVIAHIGAPDYLAFDRLGWIDMTSAPRSPGSTLKPFVYGLAFDDRIVDPETVIEDVSMRFGEYAPRNFDAAFHGELTVREALQRSLNVPAVLVLDRVGPERFAASLRRAGVRLRLPDDGRPPGLPLVLGGVAVSLEELTQLYVALARGGLTAPLIFRPDQPEALATSLLSPAAARQVLQILAGAAPPPGQVQAVEVLGRGAIAIKTGTSYGFRDAWAFGVTSRHTVGVWVGRPDGTPSPDRIGRTTAAPILWRVFDVLDDGGLSVTAAAPGQPPAELLRRIDGGDGENRRIRVADANRLRLVFPQAEMVVDASSGGSGVAPLTLIAEGGRRPLTWMIDGRPLATTPTSRQVDWQPEHLGPVRITVIDADGRVDSAPVILR